MDGLPPGEQDAAKAARMPLLSGPVEACVECGRALVSGRGYRGPAGPGTCCSQCCSAFKQQYEALDKQQHRLAAQMSAAAVQRHTSLVGSLAYLLRRRLEQDKEYLGPEGLAYVRGLAFAKAADRSTSSPAASSGVMPSGAACEPQAMECDGDEHTVASLLQMSSQSSAAGSPSPCNNKHRLSRSSSSQDNSTCWATAAAGGTTSSDEEQATSRKPTRATSRPAPYLHQEDYSAQGDKEEAAQAGPWGASWGMAALAAVGREVYQAECKAERKNNLQAHYKKVLKGQPRIALDALPRPAATRNQLLSRRAALERFDLSTQICGGVGCDQEELEVLQHTRQVLKQEMEGAGPLPTPQPITTNQAPQQGNGQQIAALASELGVRQQRKGRKAVGAQKADAHASGLEGQQQQQEEEDCSWPPELKRPRTQKPAPRHGIPPPGPWAPTAWEAAAGDGSMMYWEEEHAVPVKQYFVKRTTARRPSSWEPAQGQATPATAAPAAGSTSSMAPESAPPSSLPVLNTTNNSQPGSSMGPQSGTTTTSSLPGSSSGTLSGHKRGRNQAILPAATQQQQQQQLPASAAASSPAPAPNPLPQPATRRASCHPVVLPPAAVLEVAGAAGQVGPLSPTFSSLQGGGGAAAAGSALPTAAAAAAVVADVEMTAADHQEEGEEAVEAEAGGQGPRGGKRKRDDAKEVEEKEEEQQQRCKRACGRPKRWV